MSAKFQTPLTQTNSYLAGSKIIFIEKVKPVKVLKLTNKMPEEALEKLKLSKNITSFITFYSTSYSIVIDFLFFCNVARNDEIMLKMH